MRFFIFPFAFVFGFPMFVLGLWLLRGMFGGGHHAMRGASRQELDDLREEMSALRTEMSVIRESLADMTLSLHEIQQQALPKE